MEKTSIGEVEKVGNGADGEVHGKNGERGRGGGGFNFGYEEFGKRKDEGCFE